MPRSQLGRLPQLPQHDAGLARRDDACDEALRRREQPLEPLRRGKQRIGGAIELEHRQNRAHAERDESTSAAFPRPRPRTLRRSEVKRHCDTTINHFWFADKAQIYRTLAQLTEAGLATVETVPGAGAPDRQVHHITERGRETLRDWLTSTLDPRPERSAFLARLFFSGGLTEAQLGELLATRRATAESLLAALTQIEAGLPEATDRGARLRRATLDNGIAHARTELEWICGLQEELA
jgi:DNA-binding PadR family transcriptional regulator